MTVRQRAMTMDAARRGNRTFYKDVIMDFQFIPTPALKDIHKFHGKVAARNGFEPRTNPASPLPRSIRKLSAIFTQINFPCGCPAFPYGF
jgi:hypothetical protein